MCALLCRSPLSELNIRERRCPQCVNSPGYKRSSPKRCRDKGGTDRDSMAEVPKHQVETLSLLASASSWGKKWASKAIAYVSLVVGLFLETLTP